MAAIGTVALLALLAAVDADAIAAGPIVTWKEVRAAIADTICAAKASADGQDYVRVPVGVREACGLGEPSTVLDRAVRSGFAASGNLLVSLRIDDRVIAEVRSLPEEAWSATAQSIFLGDREFLRVLVPRVERSLEEAGFTCTDCPLEVAPQRGSELPSPGEPFLAQSGRSR